MTKKIGLSSVGADIWVGKPQAFIFLILRMITRTGIGKNFLDLMSFLRTTDYEIKDFLKTMVPSVEWLLELAKSREGRKILKAFNLPKSKEKLLLIAKEIEGGNTEPSICDLLIEDLPEHAFLGDLVTGKDFSIHLWQKDTNELIDIKGDNMTNGRGQGRNLPIDHGEQFLAGLYRIVGLCDMHGLNRVFGAERIAQFKKDGTVPYKWVEILMGYDGGKAHLERFRGILRIASEKGEKKELKLVPTAEEQKSSQEIIQPVLIPVEEVTLKAEPEIQKAQEKLVPEVEVVPKKNHQPIGINEVSELKPEVIAKVEDLSQKVVVLEARVEGNNGEVSALSSKSVTQEISSPEVKKASQVSLTNESEGRNSLGLNGFKNIPRLEVLSVLMCVQEIITGKKVAQASDLDVDCIAKELEVPPKVISTMRKGGIPMHMGHLQVVRKKYGSKSDLLEKWA